MKKNCNKLIWEKIDILKATNGEDISNKFLQKKKVTGISIDTRSLKKGDLFIAIIGENFDGHDFINSAIKKGASGIIVSKKTIARDFEGLYVDDTIKALQNLAVFSRKRFKGKVISITGSNGKTSTKNMMSEILGFYGKTHSTFQNNNNLLGLSLTLSRLEKNFDFCVLELGMNKKDELKTLSELALPDITMITNISSSHIANFNSEKEIAEEKCKIFSGLNVNGKIVLNEDDKWIDLLKEIGKKYTNYIYTYGKNPKSNLQIKEIYSKDLGTELRINNKKIFLNFLPQHYALNLSGICLVLKLINLDYKNKIKELRNLKPSFGRGNVFKIINDKNNFVEIINDSYNANLSSMIASLKNIIKLKDKEKNKKFVLVIGDMLELGKYAESSHRTLIPIIKTIKPRCLITVGNLSKIIYESLKKTIYCHSFENVKELKKNFFSLIKNDDIILIKGSNGTGLFKFTNYLHEEFLFRG